MELVRIRAGRQFTVSHSFTVDRRRWSLRPIEALAREVRELEDHHREMLNPETTRELTSLVRNLNQLLKSERERYNKYRTTLTDLTHSLKTPLAVLQSTLRSLRNER